MFFSALCLLCLYERLFICALWSPAEKGLTSWLSFVVSNCEFVTFPFGILGQVWYLIVSFLDLCTLTYLYRKKVYCSRSRHVLFLQNQAECYDYRLTPLSTREIEDKCVRERGEGRGLFWPLF